MRAETSIHDLWPSAHPRTTVAVRVTA
uniref:Uncharacterized protein n=1 Tax=Rhizophora mucronata TaxID=61149 RepID=A0A2P2Q091_RHIMU